MIEKAWGFWGRESHFMWLDRGACLGGDIHGSRDVSYKRKPTIPRSHGNVPHKRNSWCKTSELGTRLTGSRDKLRRPARGEGRGPGRRELRDETGLEKNSNFLINAMRRHWKALIAGVAYSLFRNLKLSSRRLLREWKNILCSL